MHIILRPATGDDRSALENLLQLHLYECSTLYSLDIDSQGRYLFPQFDSYWNTPERQAYVINCDDQLAGFVLVDSVSRLKHPFQGHVISEFFVLQRYRGRGIGRTAAVQLFESLPGQWEVAEHALNVPAQSFWRRVIDSYTRGNYQEYWHVKSGWRGPVQQFDSSQL